MEYVPVDRAAQFELRYLWDTERVENVLYFYESTGWTVSSMTTTAQALFNWWATNLRPLQPSNLILNEVYATDLTTQTSSTASFVPASGNVGTSASASMPNNVALAVSFRTANRGRSGRGRNYFPGLTEATVSVNEVSATTVTAIENAYKLLLNGTWAGGGGWSVVSRYTNGQPRANGLVQPVINAVVVDATVDSMRRRLPKRGT
jgi:hypothetical protein